MQLLWPVIILATSHLAAEYYGEAALARRHHSSLSVKLDYAEAVWLKATKITTH